MFKEKRSRRYIVLAGVTGAAGALLAACGQATSSSPAASAGSSSGNTSASKGASNAASAAPTSAPKPTTAPVQAKAPVNLTVKTWTNIINIPVWEQAVKRFNEANAADKITVTMEHVPDDYWTKLTAEYAAGTPPDIIYASPADLQSVALKGMVHELSAHLKQDTINLSDINPPAQLPFMWGGKVWALACWNDTRVLTINKSAFQAAGISLPPQTWDGPGWTIDDFVSAAQKLNDSANNRWGVVNEGLGSLKRMAWHFGAYYWDDDKLPTRSAFNSTENVNGLKWIRDLQYASRVMAPNEVPGQFGGWEKMFRNGQSFITWCAYKHVTAGWRDIKDFEWMPVPMPKGKTRMSNVSPQSFAIVSLTKNPNEAWTVLKDFSLGEGNAIMAGVSSMPAYKKTDVYKVAQVPDADRWMIKLLQDSMNAGKAEVPHPNVKNEMLAAMDEQMKDLMADKISPQDAARNGADKVNALFDQFGLVK